MTRSRSRTGWFRTSLSILKRLRDVAVVVARHGGTQYFLPRLARWPRLVKRLPGADLSPPERLRVALEEVGGTFIKLGQMLALQPDILPLSYCNVLLDLLDRIEPFDFAEVERVFVEELGKRPEDVFDDFDRTALSTASIGQVHVAWLDGEKVAVKIQRPNVRTEFTGDITLMVWAMSLIRRLRLKSMYWSLEALGEFVAWTREELDYRHEARYSEYVADRGRDNPAQYVPRVYDAFTTRRILVVEFLEGSTLLEYLRAAETGDPARIRQMEPQGFDRNRFAANVIDNFLGDAFRNGIYHADLHPANLLILKDNVVGYIDFGITGVMSRHARRHLAAMTLALGQGDMETLHTEFLRISTFGANADLEAFRVGLDELSAGWFREQDAKGTLRVNITRVMGDMLLLSRRTGVLPERDIVKYIRSAIAIDGLITRFAPEFEVGRYLAETAARFLHWQRQAERFSPERILDWTSSSARLLRDGLPRMAGLLDRLAGGEGSGADDRGERGDSGHTLLRARALQLAGAMLGVVVLMMLGHDAGSEPLRLGVNLWTAELVFVLAAATGLVGTLRRLNG